MTNEEEKLLLKDLAARVPYGVMVEQTLFSSTLADKEQRLKSVQANNCVQLYWYKYINEFVPIHCIKPYLRPMSSMTEEEENEWNELNIDPLLEAAVEQHTKIEDLMLRAKSQYEPLEWLNAHHFDYRGLIPMGLALEAPKDMYKTE